MTKALLLLSTLLLSSTPTSRAQKIAVIGGGISGTFSSKYLVDLDREKCLLDSITLFDPVSEIGQLTTTSTTANTDWQGSRVESLSLSDGKIVELGASVFHEANELLKEMILGAKDPPLTIGKPFNLGNNAKEIPPTKAGLGIYNGDGEWSFFSNNTDPWNKFRTVLRFNLDAYKVDRATTKAIKLFSEVPSLLNSTSEDTFFESPDEMWKQTNLIKLVHHSFQQVLDSIWVSKDDSWVTKLIPYQGSIRKELLTAINLINYNQNVPQVNGLVGLVSFAASKGPLYSVVGGNQQILKAAIQQTKSNRQTYCPEKPELLQHQSKIVTTVIGSMDGFELFSGEENLGSFDTVILAAPLQQSRIRFLIPSQFDAAVLQPMPLAGAMVDPESVNPDAHEGHAVLPSNLPACATNKFTQVVTTVISGATLEYQHFQLDSDDKLPRAVCFTEQGKEKENNITVISQIAGDGLYKIFSNNVLDENTRQKLFGDNHKVEYVKVWGGPYGGATPDYQGRGNSVGYMLYDGATGLEGHTRAGGLYYPNAIETSLACMEASAIGAKSVAKLVARRLGIILPQAGRKHDGEEL